MRLAPCLRAVGHALSNMRPLLGDAHWAAAGRVASTVGAAARDPANVEAADVLAEAAKLWEQFAA